MTQPSAEAATRAALARAQDQLAMMQMLLQALTNGCDCLPCHGLRSMAQQLALLPKDPGSAEASAQVNHGQASAEASSATSSAGE